MPIAILYPGTEAYGRSKGADGWPILFKCFDDFLAHFLGVAEQHHRVVAVEQLVLDAGIARGHRAFDKEHSLGPLDLEDRHTVDRR